MSIKGETIEQRHLDEVMQIAQSVALPAGQQLLHALPIFYIVDGHEHVLDPRGMVAMRLEAHTHLITGAVGSVHNLVRCTELAGVKVHDVILEPLASATAVLHPDERHIGVAVLDIGGGTSDFAIYQHGTIRHTKVYPIAGNLFTQDIALVLRITTAEAERLKRSYGQVVPWTESIPQPISAHRVDGQSMVSVEPQWLYEILDARLSELALMIQHDMAQHHLARYMPAGIVVTGGGSLLQGIATRLQEQLGIPVRLGAPLMSGSFSSLLQQPMHATGYGLLTMGIHKELQRRSSSGLTKFIPQTLFARMRSWIFDFM
jgi:cell division protein FtsA